MPREILDFRNFIHYRCTVLLPAEKEALYKKHEGKILELFWGLTPNKRATLSKSLKIAGPAGVKFTQENICIHCKKEECKFHPSFNHLQRRDSSQESPRNGISWEQVGPMRSPVIKS